MNTTPDTIAAAAAALRTGAVTSADLVEQSLAAIEQHNPRTNAFITVHAATARAAARRADDDLSRGLDRGPLHGIPISLKDLIDEAGIATTAASRVLGDRPAAQDAPVVTRLRTAGSIVIGRTNLHEFALGTTSEDSAFGPVHHPLDPGRSAGGSSGGSAAAVATGMGLASVGTDTGGSIRIPAAVCGLVGLKPSAGEVPIDGIVPLSVTFDHVGPLARTVQDAAWLYAVLAGRPPVTVRPVRVEGLRLARLGGYFDGPLDRTVRHAIDRAIGRLGAAGVHIEAVADLEAQARITEYYVSVALAEAAVWHAPYLDSRADLYTPPVHARLVAGRAVLATAYLEARAGCLALRAAVDTALEHVDALVLPSLSIVAPPHGAVNVAVGDVEIPVRSAMLKLTQLFNLTGHPAVSLPVASDGLPVGLQIVGRRGETARLLAVAAALEPVILTR